MLLVITKSLSEFQLWRQQIRDGRYLSVLVHAKMLKMYYFESNFLQPPACTALSSHLHTTTAAPPHIWPQQ
jgi:hypothetical protein